MSLVLAIISARGGSKSVPRKNVRLLGGQPLISYMILAAKAARLVDRVIVSTEDDEIANVAAELGAELPFRRPAELAADGVPLIASTQHAVDEMDRLGYEADVVVQLQPTCPFVPPAKIDESVEKILETDCESTLSLTRVEHAHPYRVKELVAGDVAQSFIKDVDVEGFQERQSLPPLYHTTGAIYTRRRHLLKDWSGRDFCLGKESRAVILDSIEAVNIDEEIDFLFAEFLIEIGYAKGYQSH